MTDRPWVLVTADGPQLRDPLVAVRALASGGYRPALALSCGTSLAMRSRATERVARVPRPHEPGYRAAIDAELARGGYVTVLPASEAGLLGLGGAPGHLIDKARLADEGERVGIPAAPTRVFAAPGDALGETFDFPLIVKPVVHTGNAVRVDRPADLAAALPSEGAVMVQPFLTDPMRSINGAIWRGRIVASLHERWVRTWPVDAGVASSAFSVEPDLEAEERMAKLLDGYDGLFNAQFIGPYLIDLNLRLSTTHPLAIAAGVNIIATWCDVLRGRDVDEPVRARGGAFFRWIEGDARAVAKAVRRRRLPARAAVAALRPHRGAAHATESLRDPLPMLYRAAFLARRTLGSSR